MSLAFKYRPEIDGLRCFAVLAVIAFHAKKSFLPGGYLGVDVFFVISGYLITSIIMGEHQNGNFSLAKFWDRRVKRILPAASVVLLALSIVQGLVIFRPDLQQMLPQRIAALLSFANIYFYINTGSYWGNEAEESSVLHYWSLSVEEQYYLLYPILLVFLLLKLPKRGAAPLLLMSVVSFAAFAYTATHNPNAAFYLLPARMWQLGAGCILAMLHIQNPWKGSSMGTLAGISLIGVAYVMPVQDSGLGYEALAAVTGACLVIGSGSNPVSARVLENPVALFTGRISYSLYLWHWPILLTLEKIKDYGQITSRALLGLIGISSLILLSLLSFYFIEKPFRRLKYGTPLALSLVLATGVYLVAIEPLWTGTPYVASYSRPTWHGLYYDVKPRSEMSEAFHAISKSVHAPESEPRPTAYKEGGLIRRRATVEPRIVVMGDSHATMYSKVIDDITEDLNVTTSFWSMNGEQAFMEIPTHKVQAKYLTPDERLEYDLQRQSLLAKWKPDIVILACKWNIYDRQSTSDFFQFLESHAKHVLLVESPPQLKKIGNRCVYQYLSFLDTLRSSWTTTPGVWPHVEFEDVVSSRNHVLSLVFERSRFVFLPVADLFADEKGALVAAGSEVLYLDDDHLTDGGAERAKIRLKAAIENLLAGFPNQAPVVSRTGEESRKTLEAAAFPRHWSEPPQDHR